MLSQATEHRVNHRSLNHGFTHLGIDDVARRLANAGSAHLVEHQTGGTGIGIGALDEAASVGLQHHIRMQQRPKPKNHGHQIAKGSMTRPFQISYLPTTNRDERQFCAIQGYIAAFHTLAMSLVGVRELRADRKKES